MEIKLTRFVGLFLVLLSFNATLNIADEVLSPNVRLYFISNSEQSVSLDQQFKVNKHLDFALLLISHVLLLTYKKKLDQLCNSQFKHFPIKRN